MAEVERAGESLTLSRGKKCQSKHRFGFSQSLDIIIVMEIFRLFLAPKLHLVVIPHLLFQT